MRPARARAHRKPVPPQRFRDCDDAGSATVLVVMGIGVLLICLTGALAVLSAVRASHQARAAADLSALAGAQVLVDPGDTRDPCAVVTAVAGRNSGSVQACTISGDDVIVRVTVRPGWPGLGPAQARARAGPDAEGAG